jgi:hypothetical protein
MTQQVVICPLCEGHSYNDPRSLKEGVCPLCQGNGLLFDTVCVCGSPGRQIRKGRVYCGAKECYEFGEVTH